MFFACDGEHVEVMEVLYRKDRDLLNDRVCWPDTHATFFYCWASESSAVAA